MKKVLAFVLAALLVFSVAACNNQKPTDKPADTTTKAQDTTTKAQETTTKAPETETNKPDTPKEIITVNYLCSIGAYLDTMIELINEFNEGEGKERGVFIKLESEIENYGTVLNALIEAGNAPDIFSAGTLNLEYYARGWYTNLYDIDDEEIKALIAKSQPYIDASFASFGIPADNYLCNLPLQVVPVKMSMNTDLFAEAGLEEPKTWDDVLKAAEAITNLNKEGTKGFGWSTWSGVWRNLTFVSTIPSAKKPWWNPNTATYGWEQYRPVIEAECKMFNEGWMLGADDLGIDPIRSEFSAGHVGMFISPSYDYGVFTNQFPATCNWKFIDMPVFGDGNNKAKGCYSSAGGSAICAISYNAADQAKKDAIEIAYAFIEGDKVIKASAETGAMIPFPGRIEGLDYSGLNEQFGQMADVIGYAASPLHPDTIANGFLEGDRYNVVFDKVLHSAFEGGLDAAFTDLATRYNAAYAAAKADPDTAPKLNTYEYNYLFDGN